jgi:hypothetical protein
VPETTSGDGVAGVEGLGVVAARVTFALSHSGADDVKYPDPKIEAYNVLMYQSLNQSLAQYIIQVVHRHTHMII